MENYGANDSLWLRLMEGDGRTVAIKNLCPQLKKTSRKSENTI